MRYFVLFLLLFNFDDLATLIVPAIWANRVWEAHLTTITAWHQIVRFQGVVGAATIATAF